MYCFFRSVLNMVLVRIKHDSCHEGDDLMMNNVDRNLFVNIIIYNEKRVYVQAKLRCVVHMSDNL